MANVLDSFVLEFALDPSKFTAGQKQIMQQMAQLQAAALAQAKDVESSSKRVLDVISNMRREVLTAFGVFFGGRELGEFVKYITNLDAATGRLAITMGMSASDTSAWQGAIKQAGGTAEGANSALSGLSGEMTRFQLTGQSGMLPVLSRLGVSLYDQNKQLKTGGELWLDLAEAVQGMDARQATAFLQMIPGANQDMVNFALLGRRAMESYLKSAKEAGVTTEESAAAAKEYQRALEQLEASSSNLGRTLLTMLGPAVSNVTNGLAHLLQYFGKKSAEGTAIIYTDEQLAAVKGKIAAKIASPPSSDPEAGPKEMESYIREAAVARGMDPNVAVEVARSEGLHNWKSTIPGEESYGPFQLHYGGRGQTGGLAKPGLGDEFTKQTGLDAGDRKNWKRGVDFALDNAKKSGWGQWYGWKGSPTAGGAGMGGSHSTTVNVGGVTVNTSSSNAEGIASDIEKALKRSITAGAANSGS